MLRRLRTFKGDAGKLLQRKGQSGLQVSDEAQKWCTIKLKEFPEFLLDFNVKGELVTMICDNPKLSEVVASLREYGKVPEGSITAVIYRGTLYSSAHPAAKKILRAVETGEKPEVLAVVDC